MRIAVLTGGGDVPGLNPCIKALVDRADGFGWEVFGFRRGWAGPLNVDPGLSLEENRRWLMRLTPADVRTIDRTGGTHLHTSRTLPARVRPRDLPEFLEERYPIPEGEDSVDVTPHVLEVLETFGIDCVVPIGGDDTLSYAVRLHEEGVPVLAIPKTMDNDVHGTDYCIGFSTAVTRSVDYIHQLRTPTGSHERVAVIELFGRRCGETALVSAYLADADRALISEVPFDIERVAELISADKARNPSNYAVLVVSEGARMEGGEVVERGKADAYGHRKLGGISDVISAEIKERTGFNIIQQKLAYLMRAGAPDSLDRMVAISFANLALQQVKKGNAGLMVALRDGRYTTLPADTCVQGRKRVDVDALYDPEEYRPRIEHVLGKPMFLY